MDWIGPGILVIGSLFIGLVALMSLRPPLILYAMALVVSIVGINAHLGVTIYLSRIVLVVFLFALIARSAVGNYNGFQFRIKSKFVTLFALTLFVQFISDLLSNQAPDALRQTFIYLSMMAIFITVLIVGTSAEIIVKAIKVYLVAGIIQGAYGMYQIVGGPLHWPTYQTFMAGIPMANDRTTGGYYYSGAYSSFRAVGFFPADVSHYAGFMVGICILAVALALYNRRSFFPYLVLLAGGLGLLFSFSRSGILALMIFGIPSLLFLLRRAHESVGGLMKALAVFCVVTVILGVMIKPLLLDRMDIDLASAGEIVSTRLNDVVNPGTDKLESMEGHITTRLMALDALSTSPLLGVGLGVNAAGWYSERFNEDWGGAHSHHLNILGQTGLLGACLEWIFMGVVGFYMWRGLKVTGGGREERTLLAGLLAAYITIVLGNIFYQYYLNDFVWFLMGCGVALSREIRRKHLLGNDSVRNNKSGEVTCIVSQDQLNPVP